MVHGYNRVPDPPASTIPFRFVLATTTVFDFPQPFASVFPFGDDLAPIFILQIPFDCLTDPRSKSLLRTPSAFGFNTIAIDSIAAIMPWSILNESNEFLIFREFPPFETQTLRNRAQLIENRTNRLHDLDILHLIPATNTISLSHFPFFQGR